MTGEECCVFWAHALVLAEQVRKAMFQMHPYVEGPDGFLASQLVFQHMSDIVGSHMHGGSMYPCGPSGSNIAREWQFQK